MTGARDAMPVGHFYRAVLLMLQQGGEIDRYGLGCGKSCLISP